MNELDTTTLDPGIRLTVAWLRAHGFETTDSGDGVSKPLAGDEGALEYPRVWIRVDPRVLLQETDRLLAELAVAGVAICQMGPAVDEPAIQATYDPGNGSACIMLMGVDDRAPPID